LVEGLGHVAHRTRLLRQAHVRLSVPRTAEDVDELLQVLLRDLDRPVSSGTAVRGGRRGASGPPSWGSCVGCCSHSGSFVRGIGPAGGPWATRLPACERGFRPRARKSYSRAREKLGRFQGLLQV